MLRFGLVLLLLLLSCACVHHQGKRVYAPVTDANLVDPIPPNGIHRVQRNESLYSIAWRYGVDYRVLAKRNHLSRPYYLPVGSLVYFKEEMPRTLASHEPQHRITKTQLAKRSQIKELHEPREVVRIWRRPAKGPIIAGFSGFNKGINIAGHEGDPIMATAAGRVVYSGNGLRGYGNLIIIEHNPQYLTAYAHNRVLLVKEGEWVKSGQKIAKMGDTGTTRIMLHFEIRKEGQPVNPLRYLVEKS